MRQCPTDPETCPVNATASSSFSVPVGPAKVTACALAPSISAVAPSAIVSDWASGAINEDWCRSTPIAIGSTLRLSAEFVTTATTLLRAVTDVLILPSDKSDASSSPLPLDKFFPRRKVSKADDLNKSCPPALSGLTTHRNPIRAVGCQTSFEDLTNRWGNGANFNENCERLGSCYPSLITRTHLKIV